MSNSQNLLSLSPRLIFDLAAQVHPPETVAQEYDLDVAYLKEVMELPHVKKLIKDKKRELDEQGFALAMKAKLMFEDLLPDIYRKAKAADVSLNSVLEAAKFMRQVAGLDKQDQSLNTDKFSITINMGGVAAQPVTIDVQASTVEDRVIRATFMDLDIGNPPSYLPTIQANNELAYNED